MALIPHYDARTRTALQGVSGRAQAFPVSDTVAQAVSGVGDSLLGLAQGIQTGDRINEIRAAKEAAARAKAQDENDEAWWTGNSANATLAITQGVQAARAEAPEDGKGYADNVLKVVDDTFKPYEAQATTSKARELVAKAKASARERFGTGALDYQNQALQTWRGAQVDKAEQSGLETVRTAPVDMLGDVVKTQVEAYGATLTGLDPVERVKRQAAFGAKMADAAYARRVLDDAERTGKVSQGAVGDTIERIIGREGDAFVPNDNGAPSKFGIRATEPGGKRNGKLVADLTRDEARAIYLEEYAAPMGLSETAIAAHPAFAEVAMDAAVNHGVEKAKAMVAEAGGDWRKLITLREAEYRRLAAANPAKYGDDLNGWLNRMGNLTKDAASLDRQGTDMVALLATPEAKAKAIEAGVKLVEQKNNLRRGELSVAIERGVAGSDDIARGVKEGWIQEGSPDWTALTKASDEASKKAAAAAQLQARVNQAVTQGVPLDPHNADDRKGMNADFDARSAGWKPEEWATQAVRYARQVGMVPEALKGRVVGGLRSSNADSRLSASKVYADLKANAPQAVREFSDDDVRDANLVLSYARMGMSPKEAMDAIALGQKMTPEEKAGRDRAFTAGLGPKGAAADQFLVQAINRDKDVQDMRGFMGGGFTPPVEMTADFKNAAQLAYRRTGDMDAAMNAAYDQVSRAWGPSVFNGERTFVKNAPEVVFGLHGMSADDNAKWIRRQLSDTLVETLRPPRLRVEPAYKGPIVERGNIDIHNRPQVRNPDGSVSTVRSISIGIDGGKTALIPTVVGNRVVSDEEAIKHFEKTGKHLGIFGSEADADRYAQALHHAQDKEYTTPRPAGPALDAKALRLIESPLQKSGRPVYYVMKEGDDGALAPVARDGQPLYFQPDWNSSPTKKDQDAKARKAREEEMQRALMTRQRLGVRAQELLDHGMNPVARAGGG